MFVRYQQVSRIVEAVKPSSIVEIGTWNGDHALIMATAALAHRPRVHYRGYDLFETASADSDDAEFNVRSHHAVDAVRAKLAAFQAVHPGFTFDLVRGNTRDTLTDTTADFAYIDGGHSLATIESDYRRVQGCGAIVFDDYYAYDPLGRRPDIDSVGCNRLLATVDHMLLPAFDALPSGGRVQMAATGPAILARLAADHAPFGRTAKRRAVVTTFATEGYYDYGQRFIETFDRFWPPDVDLYVYVESSVPVPASPRVHMLNMLRECPGLVEFKSRHLGNARANGVLADGREDYRFNAVKFCHKVFALTQAALTLDADELYWIDADSLTFRPVPHAFLDGLLPAGAYTSYLGRRATHSECGFMAFDLTHRSSRDFMELWQRLYAEDLVFELPEWHDSYVYDLVRRTFEDKDEIAALDLRAGESDDHHPFVNSVLGGYIDHLIGGRRKQSGSSYAFDLRKPRSEFYWQVVPRLPEDLVPLALAQARARLEDERA